VRSKFVAGGIVYRKMVHVRHCQSMAMLMGESILHGEDGAPEFGAFDYRHSSNLPQARSMWLRAQIDQFGYRWAISVDSDTGFDAGSLLGAMSAVCGNVAIGIVPMVLGDGRGVNVSVFDTTADNGGKRPGKRATLEDISTPYMPIHSGGFGLAVFNLSWFRECWELPHPEQYDADPISQGEDIQMCMSVRKRGGLIVNLAVEATHHNVVPMPLQTVGYSNGKAIVW
jgi:hypothetical protein